MANCGLSLFTNVAYAGTGSETSGVVIPVGSGSSGQVKIVAVDKDVSKVVEGVQALLDREIGSSYNPKALHGLARNLDFVSRFGYHSSLSLRTEALQYAQYMSTLDDDTLGFLVRSQNLADSAFIDVTRVYQGNPGLPFSTVFKLRVGLDYEWSFFDYSLNCVFPIPQEFQTKLDTFIQTSTDLKVHNFDIEPRLGKWCPTGDCLGLNKETGDFSAIELKTMESLNFSKVQSQIKHYSTLDYHLQLRGPARKAFLSNPDFFKNLKIPTHSQFHVSTLEPFDVPKSIQNIDRSSAYFHILHTEKSIGLRAFLLKLSKF